MLEKIKNKIKEIYNKLIGTKWFPVIFIITIIGVFYYLVYKLGEFVGGCLASWVETRPTEEES